MVYRKGWCDEEREGGLEWGTEGVGTGFSRLHVEYNDSLHVFQREDDSGEWQGWYWVLLLVWLRERGEVEERAGLT